MQGLGLTPPPDDQAVDHLTLAVFGAADWSHRQAGFASIPELVSRARQLACGGCGHFPDLQAPERFAADVGAFLEARGP